MLSLPLPSRAGHVTRADTRGDDPGLAAKVAFLGRPQTYPGHPHAVEALETHMSWLFLTEDWVYKLKKPYRHDVIDYATAAARRRSCMREMQLNRRLAPDVYRAVLALTVDGTGRLHLGGNGRCVDWLVQMRRLPNELTLEHCVRSGHFDRSAARRVVARLVPFHQAAAPASWSGRGYLRHLKGFVDDTERELSRPVYAQDVVALASMAGALRDLLQRHASHFVARIRARRVVEGHGDLRPEHIYLTRPPTIIDCIEFDRDLRLRDPADELAFLAMECDRLGHTQIDGWLFDAWRDLSGDAPPRVLVDFHKTLHAFIRAKIALWHLDDAGPHPDPHWRLSAADYLAHARRCLAAARRAQ